MRLVIEARLRRAPTCGREVTEQVYKPDSVPLPEGWWSSIYDAGYPAPPAAYPRARRATSSPSYLALLRVGFSRPARSPRLPVVSYTTVSPLPAEVPWHPPLAVCFLWHYPSGHPAWALPSTLPCGVRTFLARETRPRPPDLLSTSITGPGSKVKSPDQPAPYLTYPTQPLILQYMKTRTSEWTNGHPAFRTPHSALRTPHSAFRTPHSAFCIPHSALRTPHSARRPTMPFQLTLTVADYRAPESDKTGVLFYRRPFGFGKPEGSGPPT